MYDNQDHVGHLERREIRRQQPLARIDHDGVERRPQEPEKPSQVIGIDRGDILKRLGVRQYVQPRSMTWNRSFQERQVEPFKVLKHLNEGVVRGDVQAGVDRSKKQVEVEQNGFLFFGGGKSGRYIDGEGRAADAPGRARRP